MWNNSALVQFKNKPYLLASELCSTIFCPFFAYPTPTLNNYTQCRDAYMTTTTAAAAALFFYCVQRGTSFLNAPLASPGSVILLKNLS